ncbi:hypothetical protein [Psychrobacillus sp. MER TA 171]|uniref:hypothetical protein n=1 Tax=Psychrobacillus sp. MER TA 171 TaxID=2939577 RepID=UPI00203F569E|nr:hypothetical protein [Psychrobacillus sp. MER TA 171]MCM3358065.1 hypothetical protein [Psychrobacillus sp. MER TA 171]
MNKLSEYVYMFDKIFFYDYGILLRNFTKELSGKFKRLSPGLILVHEKKAIAMELSPTAYLEIWKLKKRKEIYDCLTLWFKDGFLNLYENTPEETTYYTNTNKLFYTLLKRLIRDCNLNVEIKEKKVYSGRQITAKLPLISLLNYYKTIIQLILRRTDAIKTKEHWFKELELFELEIIVKGGDKIASTYKKDLIS